MTATTLHGGTMQATITRPHQGSTSDEASAIRIVAGVVVSVLAVAGFMVTRDGDAAAPAATWRNAST